MAIDNVQEYIKGKIAEIEKLNKRIEKINDVLFAGQEEKEVKGKTKVIPLTAERVNQLNKKIDSTIAEIESIQANIEYELVNRSLEKDDKAKEFIDNKKEELKQQIENGKKEVEEYEQVGDKLEENEKLEKINALIKERQETYKLFKEADIKKQELNDKIAILDKEIKELESLEQKKKDLEKEINDINDKLKDKGLSKEEKESLQEQLKNKEADLNQTIGKLANKDIVLSDKKKNISLMKQQLKGIDIDKKQKQERLGNINDELKELGVTDFDAVHLEEQLNNNQDKINENNRIIDNVKKNLKIEPEKANDTKYIKEKAKEEVDKRMEQIKKLEERESTLDEAGFKKKIKDSINAEYGDKDTDEASIEHIIDKVVKERKQKESDERKETLREKRERQKAEALGEEGKEGGEGTVAKASSSYLPTLSSLKEPERHFGEKVGFFQNLRETYFSKEFREKRKAFAKEMYPELNDVELENYIDEHTKSLNYLIRTGTTIKDVKDGVKLQQEIRQERLEKIKNNPFLEKLKVDLKDGKDVQKTIDDYAQEKAKKALEFDDKDDM